MASNVKEEKGKLAKRPGKIGRYFKDVRGEMRRVVWPGRKQVLNNTGIVLLFMLLAGVVVGLFDTLLSLLIRFSLGV